MLDVARGALACCNQASCDPFARFYVSAILCGARVLDDVRRRLGSAPVKPAAKSCLASQISASKTTHFEIKCSTFPLSARCVQSGSDTSVISFMLTRRDDSDGSTPEVPKAFI